MHPILLKLGPLPIHTYGFLIALGFLGAVYLVRWLCRFNGVNADQMVDFSFLMLLAGFLGARVLFVITRWEMYAADPLDIFKIWQGGLVFYGGPLVCVPVAFWYLRKHKLPAWKACDLAVIGLTFGHMMGRFGCTAAGCCYGRPTGTDWGIKLYSELVDASHRGIPLHPVQLYEAGALFIMLLGLLYTFFKRRFDGQVVLTYFMVYPIIRSITELYRGDIIRGFVIEDVLSTSQFISILVFIGAVVLTLIRLKEVKAK